MEKISSATPKEELEFRHMIRLAQNYGELASQLIPGVDWDDTDESTPIQITGWTLTSFARPRGNGTYMLANQSTFKYLVVMFGNSMGEAMHGPCETQFGTGYLTVPLGGDSAAYTGTICLGLYEELPEAEDRRICHYAGSNRLPRPSPGSRAATNRSAFIQISGPWLLYHDDLWKRPPRHAFDSGHLWITGDRVRGCAVLSGPEGTRHVLDIDGRWVDREVHMGQEDSCMARYDYNGIFLETEKPTRELNQKQPH